jgi:transposase-like protein
MERLEGAAVEYTRIIRNQEQSEQHIAEEATGIIALAQSALDTGLRQVEGQLGAPALDDPEALSGRLHSVAADSYDCLRKGWQAVYAELPNASLPQTPMAFSQRQMYIETVKLFNLHRLAPSDGSGGSDRAGGRGFFGRSAQRPSRPGAAAVGPASQVLVSVVSGGGDVVRSALEQWHRGAMERALRSMAQAADKTSETPGEMSLPDRLELITRTSSQLVSLRKELARGLSVQWFVIGLLRKASSGIRRSEAG